MVEQCFVLAWWIEKSTIFDSSGLAVGGFGEFCVASYKSFAAPPKLVLAGASIAELFDELPSDSPLKAMPAARIVSLPELYRIPELRKEAWQTMLAALF